MKEKGNTDRRRFRVKAYAKINLSLVVTGRRPDGYHLISSRMQAISLHDDVTVEVLACSRGPAIDVRAGFAPDARLGGGRFSSEMPQGRDNLAYTAASLALRLWGRNFGGVQITVAKRIPVAAGLAGGSADAAAVTLALARMLAPDVDLTDIMKAGVKVGADVPFCIAAAARANPELGFAKDRAACSSALCEGIGDELTPDTAATGWVVLVRPAVEVSTKQTYSDLDSILAAVGPSAGNDLAPAAISRYPVIGGVIKEMRAIARADRVFMTGSGPTVVALYKDKDRASQGFSTLEKAYKNRADVGAVMLSKLI